MNGNNSPNEEGPGEFGVDRWIIVQLSGLARTKMTVRHLESLAAHLLHQDPLYVYVPVTEDFYGKKDYGYGEYIFINYVYGEDYYALESSEAFVRVLKDPHTRCPQLVTTEEIYLMQDRMAEEVALHLDDVVKVIRGNLRGNYAIVEGVAEDSVILRVMVGQESLPATMPHHNVRRSKRRTLQRKKEVEFREERPYEEEKPDFGDTPLVYILKEGVRKTKVMINDKVMMLPNEEVETLLRWIENQNQN